MGKNGLESYREKRDFSRTPEPSGGEGKASEQPLFVVHKHHASTLHYDLRLEIGGVLKSWAVPKGPSLNPRDKRLSIPTEDHPLDYAGFEGVIPEGEYGAGTVMLWDRGTLENLTEEDGVEVPAEDAVERGHIVFALKGEKLRGSFALTRFRKGKKEMWLLVKKRDREARESVGPVEEEPGSVLTGRSLKEIARE